MKKILLGIYLLGVLLLVMTLLEFIYLDKKVSRAIEYQAKTNADVNKTLQEQAKSLRVLGTDCLVLTNIITKGDYTGGQECQ